MEEKKELEILREENPEEMNQQPETVEEEVPVAMPEASEVTEPQSEPESEPVTAYRGLGAGRKESPFADSPYVMNHLPKEETVCSEEQAAQAEMPSVPKKRKHRGVGRRILAWVAVLALVAGSCAVTAYSINEKWEDRMEKLEENFENQLEALQEQMVAMSPAATGNSVSGTVAAGDGLSASQVYAKNVRSVVLIESTVTAEVYGQTTTGKATGSGFILTENGYVVTNFHVVEGATSVKVVLHNGKAYPAALVGYDSTNDLAVLKVEAQGLSPVTLGSSNALIVGDQVVAIGNPLGELTATLTVGYVSAKERTINTDGTIINMIQTDAAINSGNSGGPLFNMKGEVVGITTAKYSGASASGATIEGIGFAIPMDDVVKSIQELIQFGYIKSAYLGVLVQNLDSSVASIYGLPVGAYVAGVEEGYCAQKAGIQAKDIIIAVGDVTIENISDLTRALRSYEPGDKAKIVIYRAGQVLEILVKLDERPASVG